MKLTNAPKKSIKNPQKRAIPGRLSGDLSRFKKWRSSKQFAPYDEVENPAAVWEPLLLQGFELFLQVPTVMVTPELRKMIRRAVEKHGMRTSSLRAILEGRVPGVPKPVAVPIENIRVQAALAFADALETLVYDYLQTRLQDVESNLGD